jgi:hypothetical protein
MRGRKTSLIPVTRINASPAAVMLHKTQIFEYTAPIQME